MIVKLLIFKLLCSLKLSCKERVDLGLADHIWMDKRASMASSENGFSLNLPAFSAHFRAFSKKQDKLIIIIKQGKCIFYPDIMSLWKGRDHVRSCVASSFLSPKSLQTE